MRLKNIYLYYFAIASYGQPLWHDILGTFTAWLDAACDILVEYAARTPGPKRVPRTSARTFYLVGTTCIKISPKKMQGS